MQQVFQCLPRALYVALGQAIQDQGVEWSDVPPFDGLTCAQISIGRGMIVEAAGRVFTEGVYRQDAD